MSAKIFASAIVVALAVGFASASAHALSVSWTQIATNPNDPVDASLYPVQNTLDGTRVGEGSTSATSGIDGQARSPWDTLTNGTDDREFLWAGAGGSITFDLTTGQPPGQVTSATKGSVIWGSPDSYNKLELFQGETLVGTITTDSFGIPTNDNTYLVNFSGVTFDKLVFSSTGRSFEFSNVSAIPLPAAAVLFLSGLLAMFVVGRRRNRSQIGPHSLA